jgi:hypothetical protein
MRGLQKELDEFRRDKERERELHLLRHRFERLEEEQKSRVSTVNTSLPLTHDPKLRHQITFSGRPQNNRSATYRQGEFPRQFIIFDPPAR